MVYHNDHNGPGKVADLQDVDSEKSDNKDDVQRVDGAMIEAEQYMNVKLEKYNSLTLDQQTVALLGITRMRQAGRLPDSFKAVKLKVFRKDCEKIMGKLGGYFHPCSTALDVSPDSEYVEIVGFSSGMKNVSYIERIFGVNGISVVIEIADDNPYMISTEGGMNMVGAKFSKYSEIDGENYNGAEWKAGDGVDEIIADKSLEVPEDVMVGMLKDEALKFAGGHKMEFPPEAEWAYMLIEIKDFKDADIKRVIGEITVGGFPRSQLYITSHGGYLVCVGIAERIGARLDLASVSITKTTGFKTMVCHGGVKANEGSDSFTIDGYPSDGELEEFEKLPMVGTYMRKGDFVGGIDHTNCSGEGQRVGRDGSLCKLNVLDVGAENYLVVDGVEEKISSRLPGRGPDKFVGQEKLLKRAVEFLVNPESKLLEMYAPAGSGKSTLAEEAIKQAIERLNEGGEKWTGITLGLHATRGEITGDGLLRFSIQLAQYVEQYELMEGDELWGNDSSLLKELQNVAQVDRIGLVNGNIHGYENACLDALKLLKSKVGNLIIFADDMHEADRASVKPMWDGILGQFLMNENGVKAVTPMRPEDVAESDVNDNGNAKSMAQKNLEDELCSKFGDGAVLEMTMKGHDFVNQKEVTYEYIFHSLLSGFREGNKLMVNKEEGDYWMELAKLAGRSPLYVDELMRKILDQQNIGEGPVPLQVVNGGIYMNPKYFKMLKESLGEAGDDIGRHNVMTVEKLGKPKLKDFMSCIALLGGDKLSAKTVETVQNALGLKSDDIKTLVDRFYLTFDQEGNDLFYGMQHKSIVEKFLSLMGKEKMSKLSRLLAHYLKNDDSVSQDVMFQLYENISSEFEHDDVRFWKEYDGLASGMLNDAEVDGQHDKAFDTGESILAETNTAVQDVLSKLMHDGFDDNIDVEHRDRMVRLIIRSLIAVAVNGIIIGESGKARESFSSLEKISDNNLELDEIVSEIDNVRLQEFEYAYVHMDGEKMKNLFDEYIKGNVKLSVEDVLVCELKLACVKGDWKKVEKIKSKVVNMEGFSNEKGENYKEYLEVMRLSYVRALYVKISNIAESRGVDDDIFFTDEALNGNEDMDIKEFEYIIDDILPLISGAYDADPMLTTPHRRMALHEQLAQFLAIRGDYERAEAHASEGWRQASNMGMSAVAARIGILQSDLIMNKIMKTKNGSVNWREALRANKILQERAEKAMSKIPFEDDLGGHCNIMVKKLRSAGVVLDALVNNMNIGGKLDFDGKAEAKKIAEELIDQMLTVFSDLNVHDSDWRNELEYPDELVAYFGSSAMGYCRKAAKEFGYEIPEGIYNMTYMKSGVLENARKYGENDVVNDKYGVNAWKNEGLEMAIA